jgi:diguanylate cyclase (GGDEF)-like protein
MESSLQKTINDNYGHTMGDRILKYLVSCIKSETRHTDPLFRMGGDEFLLILRNCDLEKANEIISRIRDKFRNFQDFKPDFSYEMSYFSENIYDTIRKVDSLMYQMKNEKKQIS